MEEEEEDFSSDDTSRSMILATRRSNKRQLILNGHPVRWHASRKCTITVTSFGRRVCRTRRPTRHEYTAEFFHRRERKTNFAFSPNTTGPSSPPPSIIGLLFLPDFNQFSQREPPFGPASASSSFRFRCLTFLLPLLPLPPDTNDSIGAAQRFCDAARKNPSV